VSVIDYANAATAGALRGWDPLTFAVGVARAKHSGNREAVSRTNSIPAPAIATISCIFPTNRVNQRDDGPRRKDAIEGVSIGRRRTRVTDSIREMLDPVTNDNT
jgi:hypothetical protein